MKTIINEKLIEIKTYNKDMLDSIINEFKNKNTKAKTKAVAKGGVRNQNLNKEVEDGEKWTQLLMRSTDMLARFKNMKEVKVLY